MRITHIKQQQKDQNRVSFFVDDEYSFSLTLDQVLEQKLKKGLELDESRLKQLKKLSDEGKMYSRALEWLLKRPHSERELRDYLYRKKCTSEHIDSLVARFISKGYLNDESFARWFAEGRMKKSRSKRQIVAELLQKGISYETIQSIVTELEVSDEESLKHLVNKLRDRSRYKDNNKIMQHLISKGYSYSLVKECLNSREE